VPDPEAPLVIVSHDWLLAAVHAHPVVVVTVKLPVPPAADGDADAGESE
jgi:hypothetical protein